jgi:hypothetical protein
MRWPPPAWRWPPVSLALIGRPGRSAAGAGPPVAHQLRNGAVLIDDSYNANPGSLAAAIDALAAAPEEGWLVLGDMRERSGRRGAACAGRHPCTPPA